MHPIRRVYLIVLKELRTFLLTPTLYVCLAIFTFLCGYLHFWVGDYLNGETAALGKTFFRWLPWLYCLFAPAICMRLWSEEYRQKTFEYLITIGYRHWHLLLGKFIAAWIVLGSALILTFPIAATALWLGEPDVGSIVSGYLGSFLIAGYFLAIANACAASTSNQFIAYILGATLSSVLLMLGSGPSMNALVNAIPSFADSLIQLRQLSILAQFQDYQIGQVTLSSLIAILSFITLSLWLTNFYLSNKNRQSLSKLSSKDNLFHIGAPICFFVVLNLIGLSSGYHVDFTENKKHSLAPSTREYLSNLENAIALELIFTGSNQGIPFDHRTHYAEVKAMLKQMEQLSGGKLSITLSDPAQDPIALEKANFEGLTELLFSENDVHYFGLTARCLTQNNAIPYLHPERSHLLEYDLLLLLDQIIPRERETIGIISPYPVTGGAATSMA